MRSRSSRPPSQRQLRVGELLRHAISETLTRGEVTDPTLDGSVVTVLEVAVSPDLKHATAFVMPLGGLRQKEIVDALQRARKFIRGQVARAVDLKYTPELTFRIDTAFEHSSNIDRLLHDPRVARDLRGDPDHDE